MKPLLSLYIILIAIITPLSAKAGVAGGELTYVWVSDSTYRFFFKLYKNCDGISENTVYDLCCFNSCNPINNFTIPMPKWTGNLPDGRPNGSRIMSVCPGYPAKCQNPSSQVPDNEEWLYSTTVTLHSRCTAWRFSVTINSRNPGNNLNNANFYVEAVFNNKNFQGNSSPYFSVKPVPNVCLNHPQSYNNGAIDTNRDSLVTEVINPLTANTCAVSPVAVSFQSSSPAYSIPGNPFQTGNNFSIHNQSGKIDYIPTQAGANTLAVITKEYRNDTLVGYVMRDVQIQVLNTCNASQVTLTPVTSGFSGGGYSGGTVYSCAGQTLKFCFDVKAGNSSAILLCSDNHNLSIPGSGITYTNTKTDSVRGCFSWTPLSNDTGLKYIVVSVKDSGCSLNNVVTNHTFTIPFVIHPTVKLFKDTSICPYSPVTLRATGGGTNNFFWNTLPGGSGISSLSCNYCNNPTARPGITTTYLAVSTNPHCPLSDTVELTTLHAPVFTPLTDTGSCPNTPLILNLQPVPPAGVTYTYQWTPAAYLSNSTIPNPLANPPADTTYTVVISTSNSPCKQYDTVRIKVLKGFIIHTGDTEICIEQSIKIDASGDPNYSYKWKIAGPLNATFQPADTILNPLVTPQNTGLHILSLTARYPGCIDSVAYVKIDVQPYPFVDAGDDFSICLGKKVRLDGSVGPDYPFTISWTPATGMDSPGIARPLYTASPNGQNTLRLKASTSGGCSDSDEVVVTVYSAELLKILTPDTAICGGDTIQIHMLGDTLNTFVWFPAFNISDPLSYNPYVSPVTTTTYYAWASDKYYCTDTQTITITVKPRGMLELKDSVTVYPGQPYLMDPQGNCLYFSWFPTHGLSSAYIANPYAMPDSTIRYYVTGWTETGCKAEDSIKLILMPDSRIDMPNAFAPDSRYNAILKPIYSGVSILKRFTIYNRWGNKIFETTDMNEGWDGRFNGELQPMDVYIYTIEAETAKRKPLLKQGNITLIR